jgi:hypothetical protein
MLKKSASATDRLACPARLGQPFYGSVLLLSETYTPSDFRGADSSFFSQPDRRVLP